MEKYKREKRLIAVVLVLVMMLSMNIAVFAGSAAPEYTVDFYDGDVYKTTVTLTYNEIGAGLPDCGADGWRVETYLVSYENGTETLLEAFSYTSSADNNVVTEELMDMLSSSQDAGSAGYRFQYKAFTNREESGSGGTYTDGNGVTYTLNNGVLTITGDGPCGSYWQDDWDRDSVVGVIIESGITSIDIFAFSYCRSLTSVTIPDSVTSINHAAFRGCSSLTSVSIPNSVTSIGIYAFTDCSSLESVTIPDSVTSIGGYAFYNCSSLASVSIPDSVTEIGYVAFDGCTALTDVYYSGSRDQWNAISIEDGNDCLTNATIHYAGETHTHAYTDVVTEPTCTDKGYTTHTCDCGDSFVDTYVDALGHDYKDGVCTVCGANDPDYKEPVDPTPSVTFTDVADTAYYAAPVAWAVANNITGGYPDNTFRPMNICTRAQIVTFIWRANGCPEPVGTAQGFNDVKEGTYYYKAVLWAAEQGITGGFNDGGFHPYELVTRAQAMTFLWRAEGKPAVPEGTVNTFNDVADGAYYHDAVLWAVANGVTGGYDSSTFGSMDGCTRAQIVTFLYRDMA